MKRKIIRLMGWCVAVVGVCLGRDSAAAWIHASGGSVLYTPSSACTVGGSGTVGGTVYSMRSCPHWYGYRVSMGVLKDLLGEKAVAAVFGGEAGPTGYTGWSELCKEATDFGNYDGWSQISGDVRKYIVPAGTFKDGNNVDLGPCSSANPNLGCVCVAPDASEATNASGWIYTNDPVNFENMGGCYSATEFGSLESPSGENNTMFWVPCNDTYYTYAHLDSAGTPTGCTVGTHVSDTKMKECKFYYSYANPPALGSVTTGRAEFQYKATGCTNGYYIYGGYNVWYDSASDVSGYCRLCSGLNNSLTTFKPGDGVTGSGGIKWWSTGGSAGGIKTCVANGTFTDDKGTYSFLTDCTYN